MYLSKLNSFNRKYKNINLTYEPFSDQFHKARKNLILFSSLLFGWSLSGFKISTEISKPVVSEPTKYLDLKITITNPEVLPTILAILITYFIYRLTIEWYHSAQQKRNLLASKIDFYVSLFIGVISIILFLIHSLLSINLANYINSILLAAIWSSFIAGAEIGAFYRFFIRNPKFDRIYKAIFTAIIVLIFAAYFTIILSVYSSTISLVVYLTVFIIAVILFSQINIVSRKVIHLINHPSYKKTINRSNS